MHMQRQIKHYKKLLMILPVSVILLAAAALLFLYFRVPTQQRADYKHIREDSYDSAFLSMYSIDTFQVQDFAAFRGMTLFKSGYEIPDAAVLEEYLTRIGKSGNTITTIYLGIRPDKINSGELPALLSDYPSVIFEIIPFYPSMEYLSGLSETEFTHWFSAYEELITPLLGMENVHLFSFFAQEWFISNPANYLDDFQITGDISRLVMLNADADHPYVLTPENTASVLDAFSLLVSAARDKPQTADTLSDWTLVFFGDSIIANYTDSTSVPGVTAGLSGAQVYNFAIGGASAAWEDDESNSFPKVVGRFLSEPPENVLDGGKLCFLVNYGLNDYFNGFPLDDAQEPCNTKTYGGALRSGIRLLQDAFPAAHILVMAPNFASYFTNGTERTSEAGGILTDYVAIAEIISQDMDTHFMNNYTDLGIRYENRANYLLDGCHLNETGRFLLGTHIVKKITGF